MVDQDENDQKTKGILAYCSSAYFFSVAALYLWGYWSPFKINILEYVSLSDVIKIAAFPIASVFILVAIGMLIVKFFFLTGSFRKILLRHLRTRKHINLHVTLQASTSSQQLLIF